MQNPDKHRLMFKKPFTFKKNDCIFFIGSCFSDVIAEKCQSANYVNTLSNPFGTLFHPFPILQILKLLLALKNTQPNQAHATIEAFLGESIYASNNQFHSLYHAFRFHDTSKENLIQRIEESSQKALEFLHDSSAVFVTLGTAVYYQHQPTNTIVGNCHKLPQTEFVKSISDSQSLQQQIQEIRDIAMQLSPGKPVIFTISPVRHLRDGMLTSAVSKSLLQSALFETLGAENYGNPLFYFPSFEFVREEMAEMTKYKFDGMHVTETIENEIFEKFKQTYF